MVCNTGRNRIFSSRGLLTTVAYQLGPHSRPYYALEVIHDSTLLHDAPSKLIFQGSIAVAGAAIEWLRDNLGLINTPQELGS